LSVLRINGPLSDEQLVERFHHYWPASASDQASAPVGMSSSERAWSSIVAGDPRRSTGGPARFGRWRRERKQCLEGQRFLKTEL
jgi:hypothetical protein